MIISAMAILLGVWNYNYFDNHLVEKLYSLKPPPNEPGSKKCVIGTDTGERRFMKATSLQNLQEYFADLLPACSPDRGCCKQDRV